MSELTTQEKEWSKIARKRLGMSAIVFRDGPWICDPADKNWDLGYGSTPEEAIQDCLSKKPLKK